MTLTSGFNFKARVSRRANADTEAFGGKSLSRYFCTSEPKRAAILEPVAPQPVIIVAPVLIRRGMNI
jgi:hypothetical protein